MPEQTPVDRDASTAQLRAQIQRLSEQVVVSEAALYATGGRRVSVEHGGPLTPEAGRVLDQLQTDVETAVDAAGYIGGGTTFIRPTSITWTFLPSNLHDGPEGTGDAGGRGRSDVLDLVLAVRDVADRHNPGTWIVTTDDHQ